MHAMSPPLQGQSLSCEIPLCQGPPDWLATLGKAGPLPNAERESHSSPQEGHGALAQDLVVKGYCGRPAHHPNAHM